MTENDETELPDPEDEGPDEEYTYFVGCTCDHLSSEHGWGECNIPGCNCKGGWEE